MQEGNSLYIFHSRVWDTPERILYSPMDISSDDWNDWKVSPSKELLRPALEWEGANLEKKTLYAGRDGGSSESIKRP